MTPDAVFVVVILAVLGLAIGSFLNVVIARVPGRKPLTTPSACPHCGTPIRRRDNIPLISWIALRGRCRACGEPISVRYPLVELLGAGAFAGVGAWLVPELVTASGAALAADILELVAYLGFAAASIALTAIDLEHRRLPNVLVLPTLLGGAVLLGTAAFLDLDPGQAARAVAGAGVAFALYLIIELVSRGGVGMGDVKLAAPVGLFLAYLGWGQLAVGLFAGFLTGGLVGLVLLAARRASRRTAIPFGPWILVGAWLGILVGSPIASWYGTLLT